MFVIQITDEALRAIDTDPTGTNIALMRLFLTSWLGVVADSPFGCTKPIKLYRHFLEFCLSQSLRTTLVHYADMADEILRSFSEDQPHFVIGMLETPVAYEYIRFTRSRDPDLLRYLLTFLWWGKKLRYEDPQLTDRAFAGWSENEVRLASVKFSDDDLRDLRTVISCLLPKKPSFDSKAPKHGPGAVAEKSGQATAHWKSGHIFPTPRLDRVFIQGGIDNPTWVDRDHAWLLPDITKWSRTTNGTRSTQVSKLLFVPKTVKTARSICKEPASYMYFQQYMLGAFQNAFAEYPLNRFIRLEDQSRNQLLSGEGSWTRSLDTIDLSSASDLVHSELVRNIFPVRWVYYLWGCRTDVVQLPDHSFHTMIKFAPMGSAVCFPVQSVIFLAIILLVYTRKAGAGVVPGKVTRQNVIDIISRIVDSSIMVDNYSLAPVAVYGDDLILDSRFTDEVSHLLDRLGFRVNLAKSFVGDTPVRESCGYYWFDGQDVTPTLFRVKPPGNPGPNPEHIASVVAAANACFTARLWTTRRLLVKEALQLRLDPMFIDRNRSMDGLPPLKAWGPQYQGDNPIGFTEAEDAGFAIRVRKLRIPRNQYWNRFLQYGVTVEWRLTHVSVIPCPSEETDAQNDFLSHERYRYMRWWADVVFADPSKENIPRRISAESITATRIGWATRPIP